MGLAVLLFGIVVGIFQFQADSPAHNETEMLASEVEAPAGYDDALVVDGQQRDPEATRDYLSDRDSTPVAMAPASSAADEEPEVAIAEMGNVELSQMVADRVAANPDSASSVIKMVLAGIGQDSTLGDIATLVAAATRAAPGEAPAIAGAVTRGLRGHGDAALAAAVATIVSLVPEQSRDVGMVVGAIVGDNPETLGMVAQTVAISTGEATFQSLSEASGVSVAKLMDASSGFGVDVPYAVPAYAAQVAPSPSQVAGGVDGGAAASRN